MSTSKSKPALEIQLENDVAQGIYVNLAVVNHTDTEVTLDLIYVQPQELRGTVRSRVIVSPRHAKRLLRALQENLDRYEQTFGEIKIENTLIKQDVSPYH
ncbi:DUF3467 domain-containing protein [Geopsychrobacter electrodiphilus]|uniref:DUF3467 domain-containing protein n=1 Tax=Geopsychrobacter electrodiphilus TaxID=225196 RepID=UPI000373A7F0|nr:DUF3467 domain-containing protein [Geopsychrobacter electrodiphilus]